MTARAALVFAGLLIAAPAFAQMPMATPAACTAPSDAALPAALSGWIARSPLAAAANAAEAAKAALPIGKGVDAQLKRNGEVVFPVLPGKPGGTVSYGGLFEIPVTEAGDYQVSLGAGAWIEVTDGKVLIESTAHAPGVACTSLKKLVVFPLKPGRYLLEVTGNGAPVLPVMVSRVAK